MTVKIARLESFKYPDAPRYFHPTAIAEDTPEHLMLFHPIGTPFWNGKLNTLMRSPSHAITLLFPDKDFNVAMSWDENWVFRSYYVNMALPMQWDGELCSYIDLDLDVLWTIEQSKRVLEGTETPTVHILDRDEYEERKVLYNYPTEIMERSEASLVEVLRLIEARLYPFDHSLLSWRPTDEMLELRNLPDSATLWHLEQPGLENS